MADKTDAVLTQRIYAIGDGNYVQMRRGKPIITKNAFIPPTLPEDFGETRVLMKGEDKLLPKRQGSDTDTILAPLYVEYAGGGKAANFVFVDAIIEGRRRAGPPPGYDPSAPRDRDKPFQNYYLLDTVTVGVPEEGMQWIIASLTAEVEEDGLGLELNLKDIVHSDGYYWIKYARANRVCTFDVYYNMKGTREKMLEPYSYMNEMTEATGNPPNWKGVANLTFNLASSWKTGTFRPDHWTITANIVSFEFTDLSEKSSPGLTEIQNIDTSGIKMSAAAIDLMQRVRSRAEEREKSRTLSSTGAASSRVGVTTAGAAGTAASGSVARPRGMEHRAATKGKAVVAPSTTTAGATASAYDDETVAGGGS